ncbi:MAG TPA: 4-hydroxybenzoate octaprenyltransferase [Verrucomicrobiae bacterium]|nr:4-hydroxybenzoate octaprenyltransferase [Verrucomicrobiae bacterium]
MREKLGDYWVLMRLDRPIGTWLLLWPTLWGLWFAAGGVPPLKVLVIFVLGTLLMRSAGCVVNDLADRDFDPHIERTRNRPIAAGRITPVEAVRLFVVLCLIAFGLVTQLNTSTVLLSLPAVAIAASYPFAKRFHPLPQAHLGIAFSWGIPMAFAAMGGPVPWKTCALLMLANLCWAIAYDTFYAMVDREDDLKVGVKSSAILFGRHDRAITALLQAATLVLLAAAGRELGAGYFFGLALAAGLALYQQWLIRDRERTACFRAFLNNTWFGAAVFGGLAIALAG